MTDFDEYTYDKVLSLTVRYNRSLHSEKSSRLPFLDSATGIAQRPSLLHRRSCERQSGFLFNVFRYTPHKWKKSKRSESQIPILFTPSTWHKTTQPSISTTHDLGSKDADDDDSRSTWAAAPDYDFDSEGSENIDETYGIKKKRRRTRTSRSGRSFGLHGRRRCSNYSTYNVYDDDSNDRTSAGPIFICDVCGVRYRSRTGLNYHLNSQHPQVVRPVNGRVSNSNEPQIPNQSSQEPSSHESLKATCVSGSLSSASRAPVVSESSNSVLGPGGSAWIDSSLHDNGGHTCDFCLGDTKMNRKTGSAEGMLRCSDCGRCAHFSCLQFTPNMIASVKTYRWQCIECKTCWLCGTSENDEQMLFCDDCDRGYHLYCLIPPLDEPPEGSWSCQLCVEHFRDSAASRRTASDQLDSAIHRVPSTHLSSTRCVT